MAAHRAPVASVTFTDNADLMAAAAKLFLRDGMRVADVTWGKGIFWRKIDVSRFKFMASDIRAMAGIQVQADFRRLPYADASFDALICDPPYLHSPSSHAPACRAAGYGNIETTAGMLHDDIMALYAQGIAEAGRADLGAHFPQFDGPLGTASACAKSAFLSLDIPKSGSKA